MLIKNASLIITPSEVKKNQSILIEGNIIKKIGPSKGMDKTDEVIDASGFLVMPGLINAHTHLAMTLFRGYEDNLPLQKWLEKIFPVEDRLTEKHVYWGSMLGCLEMIKSGTTCFNDMYYFMDEVAKSVGKTGIRGCLTRAISSKGNWKKRLKTMTEKIKNIKNSSRIEWILGPHAIYTCSEELLVRIKELADNYNKKIHIHVSETEKELKDCLREHGKRPVEYLDDIGLMSNRTIAAHCCWLNDKEMDILSKRGVSVVHNPVSNMKLAAGIAPVVKMLEKSINVSLGTDGAASNNNLDMFEEMKTASLLQKISMKNSLALDAKTCLKMATINGAKALGINSGVIESGKKADLILINLKSPNLKPMHNPYSTIVYSCHGENVDTTIVDGKVLMKNRKTSLDEEKIYEKIEDCKAELF